MELYNQPKTKRGEKTLGNICRAAEKLFAEKGYYNTQIADITKEAGIAAGTFYIYFPDKIGVFRHLLKELGHELRKEISTVIKTIPDPLDAEALGIRTFFNFVSEHIGLFEIVWQAQFVDKEGFKNYYERFSAGYMNQIEKGQQSGKFRILNPVYLSYYLMGMYNFIALKSFVFDKKRPDEEMINEMIDFIQNGIKTKS